MLELEQYTTKHGLSSFNIELHLTHQAQLFLQLSYIVNHWGSLKENVSRGLQLLIAWSLMGGAVQGGLGGVILLEKVYHWRWALKDFKCLSLCFLFSVQDAHPRVPVSTTVPLHRHHGL